MLRQILEAIDLFAPDAVLFGIDDRRLVGAGGAYPAYKAGRAEKDPALVDQLERAGRAARRARPAHRHPARAWRPTTSTPLRRPGPRGPDWNCVLITSDRDSFAHISDRTQVLRLITGGIAGSPLLTPAAPARDVRRRAENYLEFAALRGDSSDNLPGCPGSGRRSRRSLLSEMGSMKAVWADIDHCAGETLVATLDS